MLRKVAPEVYRILKNNSFAAFWFGPTHHQVTLDILREAGFTMSDVAAVWFKNTAGQTNWPDRNFGSAYEPFWLARKGQPSLAMSKRGRSNVFQYDMVPSGQKIHATEKPLALMKEIVEACCLIPGSRILVPFLGSGVTLQAAYDLGHTGFGWDLSGHVKDKFLARVRQPWVSEIRQPCMTAPLRLLPRKRQRRINPRPKRLLKASQYSCSRYVCNCAAYRRRTRYLA